jgi:hypothetical protein
MLSSYGRRSRDRRLSKSHNSPNMTHPTLYLLVFIVAGFLAWQPGNWVVRYVAHLIIKYLTDRSSSFASAVGTCERLLYIAAVLGHHYELVAGWIDGSPATG